MAQQTDNKDSTLTNTRQLGDLSPSKVRKVAWQKTFGGKPEQDEQR